MHGAAPPQARKLTKPSSPLAPFGSAPRADPSGTSSEKLYLYPRAPQTLSPSPQPEGLVLGQLHPIHMGPQLSAPGTSEPNSFSLSKIRMFRDGMDELTDTCFIQT